MVIIVADIGINHNGDINIAKKLIAGAKAAGVDYVKFQKRNIDLVYSEEELNKPRESPWGTTTRQQKEGLEFSYEEYIEIDRYCKEVGIRWIASPWDIDSVDFLAKFNPDYVKIPSALITYKELLRKIAATNIPVILSTGMSTIEEINAACSVLGEQINYLLHCTSTYPCVPSEINLKCIPKFIDNYPYKIGFSNHSPSILFIPMAVTLGAEMVEFHITLDRAMYGSDQAASVELTGMARVCDYIRSVEDALGNGEKTVYSSEVPAIAKMRRY